MAESDPWDVHLEALTQKLEQMTSTRLRGHVLLVEEGGWTVAFRGAGRSVTAQFAHADGTPPVPGDYALAVIYGCDFQPIGDEGRPSGFGKTLTYREGYSWDEQAVREVVLEAIGILRYVLGVHDASAVVFEDQSHMGPLAAARSSVQRRKKR